MAVARVRGAHAFRGARCPFWFRPRQWDPRIDTSSRLVRPGDVVTAALIATCGCSRCMASPSARGSPRPPAPHIRISRRDEPRREQPQAGGARGEGSGRPMKRERREIDRWQGARRSRLGSQIARFERLARANAPVIRYGPRFPERWNDLRRQRNCIKCKYMDCVEVCPVDCFYEGAEYARHSSGRMHRLRGVRTGMPGRRDQARHRAGPRATAGPNAEYAKTWPNITVKKERAGGRQGSDGRGGKIRNSIRSPERRLRWPAGDWPGRRLVNQVLTILPGRQPEIGPLQCDNALILTENVLCLW